MLQESKGEYLSNIALGNLDYFNINNFKIHHKKMWEKNPKPLQLKKTIPTKNLHFSFKELLQAFLKASMEAKAWKVQKDN